MSTLTDLDYPETDEMPMGETDIHRQWMIRIHELLRHRYAGEQVYVGSDLLVYYTEGEPSDFVVPDVFVVLDCDPSPRRTFQIWDEGRSPDVVIEVTSRGTKEKDRALKPRIYAELGVRELFLYDPTAEYLHPALQGFRLGDGPEPIEPSGDGRIACRVLELTLRLDGGRLVIEDAATGRPLQTEAEAERAARVAAEAEIERLRRELEQARRRG